MRTLHSILTTILEEHDAPRFTHAFLMRHTDHENPRKQKMEIFPVHLDHENKTYKYDHANATTINGAHNFGMVPQVKRKIAKKMKVSYMDFHHIPVDNKGWTSDNNDYNDYTRHKGHL